MEEQKPIETPAAVDCDCACIHKLGFVEMVNPDGSKSQIKADVAKTMIAGLEGLKKSLGVTV
jgi:hypothetical protein